MMLAIPSALRRKGAADRGSGGDADSTASWMGETMDSPTARLCGGDDRRSARPCKHKPATTQDSSRALGLGGHGSPSKRLQCLISVSALVVGDNLAAKPTLLHLSLALLRELGDRTPRNSDKLRRRHKPVPASVSAFQHASTAMPPQCHFLYAWRHAAYYPLPPALLSPPRCHVALRAWQPLLGVRCD